MRDAAVLVRDGRIVQFASRRELTKQAAPSERIDLGDCVLVPGLINAHTHLELSRCKAPRAMPAGGFVGWIKNLMSQMPADAEELAATVESAVIHGVRQCLKFGVTTIGDISRNSGETRRILRRSPLRVISFGEISAMAKRRDRLGERLAEAIDRKWESKRVIVGISPHAPYSVEAPGYRTCLKTAERQGMPLCTHLAENPEESEFLEKQTGPFRELWNWLDAWDDSVPKFAGGPIRFAENLGMLNYPTVLAHVNYCDDEEVEILARGQASVVYCPRTHWLFEHPAHRWKEMLRAGINVAVGTDSCASSPNLNLIDDLRLIHVREPNVSAMEIWQLATVRAAAALQLPQGLGTFSPGAPADLIALPCPPHTDDPLRWVLDSDVIPTGVWIDGHRVT
jgi:cytosine/adenosine deaminase-related metal-dependent hydrolase